MSLAETQAPPSIAAVLASAEKTLAAANVEEPRRTARTLLCFVLDCDQAYLIAHDGMRLGPEQDRFLEEAIARRAGGEPTQHITGRREFFQYDFEVGPAVLIPRPETELLVETALARLRGDERVLDAGTGSGCIALALKEELPGLQVMAGDLSAQALTFAQRNAANLGAAVSFVRADWLKAFRDGALDVIVSNPPYIAEHERGKLPREVLREPENALFAGEDGLASYRRLIPQAARSLRPGGLLLLELGHDSLPGVRELLADWSIEAVEKDLAGWDRVIVARRAEA